MADNEDGQALEGCGVEKLERGPAHELRRVAKENDDVLVSCLAVLPGGAAGGLELRGQIRSGRDHTARRIARRERTSLRAEPREDGL